MENPNNASNVMLDTTFAMTVYFDTIYSDGTAKSSKLRDNIRDKIGALPRCKNIEMNMRCCADFVYGTLDDLMKFVETDTQSVRAIHGVTT